VLYLVIEVLLRLSKVLLAAVLGLGLFFVLVGPFGNPPTIELLLLSWLAAVGFVLLVQSSPI
jgi:hypothetical protein